MSSHPVLGQLVEGDQHRDAIHVAVIPVIAGEDLGPGHHVGIVGGLAVTFAPKLIGIVDPFYEFTVLEGEKFWMMLYPGSITSLRHDWTHPDLLYGVVATEPATEVEESIEKRGARHWLEDFALRWGMPFNRMVYLASNGEGIVANGRDIHSWSEVEDGGYEFWRQMEIFTGRQFGQAHRESTYFSCSC